LFPGTGGIRRLSENIRASSRQKVENPRADLGDTYRDMSDEELLRRWSEGQLTDVAMDVAREEFARRAIVPPPIVRAEVSDAIGPEETVTFVTVARSLVPTELQILRARLEGDGIPALVVDEGINRINSLWSIAVGGARLLVPQQFAADAKQIIALVRSGSFSLREGDDVG
jgi:hypothetical protein